MNRKAWHLLGKSCLIFPVLAFSTPLYAGWQNAEWGMTAEEVETAMEGQAPLDRGRRDDRLGDKDVRNVGEYRTRDARFRTVYYYDEAGLSHVSLTPVSGRCEKIVAALVAEHGKPLRISDQPLLRLVIWHDKAKQNRIRLMLASGICDINYERLSDYTDFDLDNAQAR